MDLLMPTYYDNLFSYFCRPKMIVENYMKIKKKAPIHKE